MYKKFTLEAISEDTTREALEVIRNYENRNEDATYDWMSAKIDEIHAYIEAVAYIEREQKSIRRAEYDLLLGVCGALTLASDALMRIAYDEVM